MGAAAPELHAAPDDPQHHCASSPSRGPASSAGVPNLPVPTTSSMRRGRAGGYARYGTTIMRGGHCGGGRQVPAGTTAAGRWRDWPGRLPSWRRCSPRRCRIPSRRGGWNPLPRRGWRQLRQPSPWRRRWARYWCRWSRLPLSKELTTADATIDTTQQRRPPPPPDEATSTHSKTGRASLSSKRMVLN